MYNEIIKTIESTISDYESGYNTWKKPIIEIISANNDKLKTLKNSVSIDHLKPSDILPDAKSIICFFIPYNEDIIKSNMDGEMASREWALTYRKTNKLIKLINEDIETLMEANGYKTGKIPATHNFDKEKLISNWSHRHIAFITGIGTFGYNNMLITKNGCCGRLGSIITSYEFDEYNKIEKVKEKCLYKLNGSCGVCRKRCVTNAFKNNEYNRFKCYEQCLKNAEYHKDIGYTDVCGKCMTGLPCSTSEPKEKL